MHESIGERGRREVRRRKSAKWGLCFLTASFKKGQPFTFFKLLPIRHANTVITILGLTSTRSSGRAYTLTPIFRATEIAYLRVGSRDTDKVAGGETTGNLASDVYQGNLWGAVGGTYFALFSLSSGVSSPVFTISYLMALGMMVSIRSITGRLVLIDLSWNHTLHRRFKWRKKKLRHVWYWIHW